MSPSSIWPKSDEVTETTEIFLIFFQSLICCCVFSSLKAERIMRLNTSCEIIPWEKTLTVFQRRPTDICFCNCGAAIRMYVAFFFVFVFCLWFISWPFAFRSFWSMNLLYMCLWWLRQLHKAAADSVLLKIWGMKCMLLLCSLWRVCWYIWWQHVCGCSRFLKNKQNYWRGVGFFLFFFKERLHFQNYKTETF